MAIKALVYDTSTGKWYAQLLGSTQISDNAIISGKLGSGVVGAVHMAPFTSGWVIIGQGVSAAPVYGELTAGTVANESITSAKLASGAVIGDRLAYGAVLSGHIGANIIATPHIANQGILSASIGTNILGATHIQNQGLASANYGAGSIGNGHVANFGIVSGKYASGSITEQALASGLSIDLAEILQDPSFRAEDLISGYLAVQFSISGYFNYSQAGGVRMPAVALAAANILSGQVGTILGQGRVTNAGWDFSGHIGELVFVGTSSEVTVTAPSASGQCVQRFGKVVGGQTIYLTPDLTYVSLAE